LSERWIQVSEKILSQLKRLEEAREKDRLEYVRSIRFTLSALQRSLLGWMQWVNNPDIMTRFTQGGSREHEQKTIRARAFLHRIRFRGHQARRPEGTKSDKEG